MHSCEVSKRHILKFTIEVKSDFCQDRGNAKKFDLSVKEILFSLSKSYCLSTCDFIDEIYRGPFNGVFDDFLHKHISFEIIAIKAHFPI